MKILSPVAHTSYVRRPTQQSNDKINLVDDRAVRSAAGVLEGTAEIYGPEADQRTTIKIEMTVSELRNFVAYMRNLDARYRELEKTVEREKIKKAEKECAKARAVTGGARDRAERAAGGESAEHAD